MARTRQQAKYEYRRGRRLLVKDFNAISNKVYGSARDLEEIIVLANFLEGEGEIKPGKRSQIAKAQDMLYRAAKLIKESQYLILG